MATRTTVIAGDPDFLVTRLIEGKLFYLRDDDCSLRCWTRTRANARRYSSHEAALDAMDDALQDDLSVGGDE